MDYTTIIPIETSLLEAIYLPAGKGYILFDGQIAWAKPNQDKD